MKENLYFIEAVPLTAVDIKKCTHTYPVISEVMEIISYRKRN